MSKKPAIAIVTGGREYTDLACINLAFDGLVARTSPSATTLHHGDCQGADRLAAAQATERGFLVEGHPPKWKVHGKAAGPIRNKELVDLHPDYVLIFHDNLISSKGTKNCVQLLLKQIKRRPLYKPKLWMNGKPTSTVELTRLLTTKKRKRGEGR